MESIHGRAVGSNAYTADGRKAKVKLGNGLYETYDYRPAGTATKYMLGTISPGQFTAANNRLNMAGVSYDAAGNQTSYDELTLEYDAEGRNTKVKDRNIDYVTFTYDGEGRRVKKISGGITTYYVYDALGQLGAEYSNQAPSNSGVSYLFTDMLGSVRTITDGSGAVKECYDYLPFGRMLTSLDNGRSAAGCHPPGEYPDSRVDEKFTGKKRDNETGLDYFGARYMSGPEGRFMSPDPSMLSTVKAIPQSWNRYTYVLNNPLRYIDPNGELWISSNDASNPYSWVDECGENQTCHETIAARVGDALRVYGSSSARDITDYATNEHGMIDVANLSGHVNANFESIQTLGQEENFLGIAQALTLFNVGSIYGQNYPADSPLVLTGASTATGGSAIIRQSHQNGTNIDLRYMGADGTSLTGNTAAANGDPERNMLIMNLFAQQNAGLGAAITGDPARYGLGALNSENLRLIHRNHMHFQNTYPARMEPRIMPGQR